MRLVLASASPRRRDLLASLGIEFDVDPVDIDERRHPGEDARAYVARLAREKAAAAAVRHPRRVVLGADTAVVVDRAVLGKPVDAGDARRMLRLLSGRAHEVLTGVAITSPDGTTTEVARTTVGFDALTDEEIAAYVDSGEPMDKAGAYAIQGGAARFVNRVDGSYSNVVGLPLDIVARWLAQLGLNSGVS